MSRTVVVNQPKLCFRSTLLLPAADMKVLEDWKQGMPKNQHFYTKRKEILQRLKDHVAKKETTMELTFRKVKTDFGAINMIEDFKTMPPGPDVIIELSSIEDDHSKRKPILIKLFSTASVFDAIAPVTPRKP